MLTNNSLSLNTRATYNSAVRNFEHFAAMHAQMLIASGKVPAPTWPADTEVMRLWIAHLSQEHKTAQNKIRKALKPESIKLYLYAIGTHSEMRGLPNTVRKNDALWRTWKGCQNSTHVEGKAERYPVTPALIRQIQTVCNPSTSRTDAVLMAAFTMATFGLLRSGEIAVSGPREKDSVKTLTWSNVVFQDETNRPLTFESKSNLLSQATQYIVHLRSSKTDRQRRGVDVRISSSLAVESLLRLLSQWTHWPINPNQPVFALTSQSMEPLTRKTLVLGLRNKLSLLNSPIDPMFYSGHSFRRGGACALLENGTSDQVREHMGRWVRLSQSMRLYADTHSLIEVVKKAGRDM